MKNLFKAESSKKETKSEKKGGEEQISKSKVILLYGAKLMILTELLQGVVLVTESLLKLKKK